MEKYLEEQQRKENQAILDMLAADHHEGHDAKAQAPDQETTRAHIRAKIVEALDKAYRKRDEKLRRLHPTKKLPPRNDLQAQAEILEHHLYHTTSTWAAYQDESTLNRRLQSLVQLRRKCRRKPVWQEENGDHALRCQMIEHVKDLIQKRLPQYLVDNKKYILHRLPLMAQCVEEIMYREATSRQEYADFENLTSRLHCLALEYMMLPTQHVHHHVYGV